MFLSPVVCLHKQCDRAGGSAAAAPNIANATQQANEKLPCVRLALQSSQVSACARARVCVRSRAEQMFRSLEKMAPLCLFNTFAAQPYLA